MCLYPKLIKNKKFLPNKKNNYNPPKCKDERLLYVPIGCGNCIECRKKKANEWRIRLGEEIKVNKHNYFITLSISNEQFEKLINETQRSECNALATIMVRRFLERWRKKYKKSLKHWLITELGEENDRLHLHGFIFTDMDNAEFKEELANIWQYGNIYVGQYCTLKTINYCIKYVLKIDTTHKDYKPIILCSKGLGASYINNNIKLHKFNADETTEYYTTPNGNKLSLPIYYRNHYWNDEERQKLWLQKIEEHKIYINGIPFDISTEQGVKQMENVRHYQQIVNEEMGFGNDNADWKAKDYNITLKRLNGILTYQNKRKIT